MKLRSHIPIAAPARREACDGSESPLRPVLGFEPRWFHTRCGVDFGERWHRDPDYRRATLIAMRNELRRGFPEVDQWRGGEERDVSTIAGCFGVGVLPAVFGMPLRFYPDRWPHPEAGCLFSEAAAERLDIGRLLSGPFVEQLLNQVDAVAARWGTVHGDLNWQGVLNAPLIVVQPETLSSELLPLYPVFFAEVIDRVALLLVQPAGDGNHEQSKRVEGPAHWHGIAAKTIVTGS